MMEDTGLRGNLHLWVEALQKTCSGCHCKESVWVIGRTAKDKENPCNARSKSSYSMFHFSSAPLSSCPSSHYNLACNLKSLSSKRKTGRWKTEWSGKDASDKPPQMVGRKEPWNEERGGSGHRSKEEIRVTLGMKKRKLTQINESNHGMKCTEPQEWEWNLINLRK